MIRVALGQLTTNQNVAANLEQAKSMCRDAKERGASWILFPENAPFLGREGEKLAFAEPITGPTIRSYQDYAREFDLWVTIGSYPESSPNEGQTYNSLVMISPDGEIAEVYRKIHLFDADTSAGYYMESKYVLRGDDVKTCVVEIEGESIVVGLSICYDLRFPELYRLQRSEGAEILLIPAAFILETGRAHWHPLLQARSIENQAYVLAPNQFGNPFGNRVSYGHSAVYDPWGQLIACAPDKVCLITADLDLNYLRSIRERMPVDTHRTLDIVRRKRN